MYYGPNHGKGMKVLIVNAPLSLAEQAGNSSLAKVGNLQQPLGVLYIAAVLEKEGFDVIVYDCPQLDITMPELRDLVAKEKPSLIGYSCTTLSFNNTVKSAKLIKEAVPDTTIILGGPHVAADPKGCLDNDIFDVAITGEAEYAFLEMAELLRDGKYDKEHYVNVKGLLYKDKGMKGEHMVRFTPSRGFINNLDELPFPARHLVAPLPEYKATIASSMRHPVGSLMSSRGCPAQCKFCDRSVFGNRFRAHSAERLVDECELLIKKFGAREIKFWDDTFTLNQARIRKMCDLIHERKLDFVWTCLTRVDASTPELFKMMKKAGCWQVLFGIEHGNDEMLKKMKKGTTSAMIRKAVRWAKDAGLNVRGSFVVGYPGETSETMEENLVFAKSLPLDVASFYVFTPYHGTEAFHDLVVQGKIKHNDYDHYHEMIDPDTAKLAYVPDGMTEEEIKVFMSKCYKEFFLRPSYIWGQIKGIRHMNQVLGYVEGLRAVVGL
tara:strand:- start:4326 stop:5804 length:1479 start_codon:yes stop_codon:yes gene_type:complete